jgi:hypothetical protein
MSVPRSVLGLVGDLSVNRQGVQLETAEKPLYKV